MPQHAVGFEDNGLLRLQWHRQKASLAAPHLLLTGSHRLGYASRRAIGQLPIDDHCLSLVD